MESGHRRAVLCAQTARYRALQPNGHGGRKAGAYLPAGYLLGRITDLNGQTVMGWPEVPECSAAKLRRLSVCLEGSAPTGLLGGALEALERGADWSGARTLKKKGRNRLPALRAPTIEPSRTDGGRHDRERADIREFDDPVGW